MWQSVASSMIEAVSYDPSTRKMKVRFRNGTVHSYDQVPEEEHAALMAAPSQGRHFLDNIRDKYTSSRG